MHNERRLFIKQFNKDDLKRFLNASTVYRCEMFGLEGKSERKVVLNIRIQAAL